MGVDARPVKMTAGQKKGLSDPMAVTFFRKGLFPMTLAEVMDELDAAGVVPQVKSFLSSEAGQIAPEEAPGLKRDFRFAVVRSAGSDADLMISTSASDLSPAGFLQVLAWDDRAGVFNYYMRIDQAWVWSGNSYTALKPESRLQACFDSHVNGSVVMKELKQPWMHWQSQNASLILADGDPLKSHPLTQTPPLAGAEELEAIVRAGVARWTAARLDRALTGGRLTHPDWLLRQLITTTTVNLATAPVEFRRLRPEEPFAIPLTFWLNSDALLDILGLPAEFRRPVMPGGHYLECVERYEFALVEGGFRKPGDGFFAFVVPEPAFEDLHVVDQMVRRAVVTDRFAASVLMVDFCNPVFSSRREALMKYCPAEAAEVEGLSDRIAGAITAAGERMPGSPEAEFAANWRLGEAEWMPEFASRLDRYMEQVNRRIATQEGVDDYVRLAESRRREFRSMRLSEFSLTLPATNIPADAPRLVMNPDGTVGTGT